MRPAQREMAYDVAQTISLVCIRDTVPYKLAIAGSISVATKKGPANGTFHVPHHYKRLSYLATGRSLLIGGHATEASTK